MIHENFVIVGSIISFLGSSSYLIDTIRGRVRPNRVSYFLWSLAPLVIFYAQIKSGVGIQSLLAFTLGLYPLLIFIASFLNKKSEWKLTTFDFVCGALSLIGFVLYLVTKEPVLAIIFSILADGLAALPTLVKSYYYPETENQYIYLTDVISSFLTLLTVKSLSFINSAFTIYILIICSTLFLLIQFKLGKKISKVFNLKQRQVSS